MPTLGRLVFLHPYPHKPRRHRSAITGGKPSSTSGKEAIPQYFPSAPQPTLEPAPNTTTTQLMGTGRSQRRPGPTLVFMANANRGRPEYRALPLSSERLVCGCLVCSKKKKKNDLVKLNTTQIQKKKRSDRGCLSPPRQPYSHSTSHRGLAALDMVRRFSDGGDLSYKHTDWFAALPSCIITPTLRWLGEHVYTLSAMFPPDSSAPLMDLVSRGQSPLPSRVTRKKRILLCGARRGLGVG